MDVQKKLMDHLKLGTQLVVIYNGGSSPGSARAITPIELKGEKLIARCHATNSRKTFIVSKINIPTDEPIEPYKPDETANWALSDHLDKHRAELAAYGLHIESSGERIALFSHFKNGKVRKTPDAAVFFEKYTSSNWDEVAPTISTKPWKVAVKGKATRSFAHLDRAASAFFAEVRARYSTS